MIIPEQLNPTFMAHLKAKSKDSSGYRQTLAEHTWLVLSRLADQYLLRPTLGAQIGDERLWARMFYACLLHDFGKAAQGFQERLLEQPPANEWSTGQHRHEVLSLAFVDWLFPPEHPDRLPVICAIVSHHRDLAEIHRKYGAIDRTVEEKQRVAWLITQLTETEVAQLWRWLIEYAEVWRIALGMPALLEPPAPRFSPIEAKAIYAALDECSDYIIRYEEIVPDTTHLVCDLLYRGLILTADHAASAGTQRFPALTLTREVALRPLTVKKREPRAHQTKAGATIGSAIMMAPTGSGKTEAALLWAAGQIATRPAARLFYTLPYQASMNAMYERLLTRFFGYDETQVRSGQCEEVTIQHSRALLKFYQDLMGLDEATPKAAKQMAGWLRNLGQLNFHPIRVFSPYQLLKAGYSLKGYETLLVDYTDALFIFDEIHAYEAKRLALIISMISWLRRRFHARFLVMTATLPPPVQEKLIAALDLPPTNLIQATNDEFIRSQRHTVHLLPGRLEEVIIPLVQADWQAGRAVLICLNRVADAQHVYRQLKRILKLKPEEEIVLLHSRFNGEDRSRKERILLERAGVGRRQADARPFITVATQVVEVSLDVDFDTIYTDPAPLEALLQRFGRVNRGRDEAMLCPVHVFRQPNSLGRKRPYLPYDELMVNQSLTVLEDYCGGGRTVDESLVTTMLKKIYQGPVLSAWNAEYAQAASEFQTAILEQMKPYHSAGRDLQEQFYEMFDGIEVVPCDLLEHYQDALEANGYLDASRYLVNISKSQYGEFNGYGLIKHARALEGAYVDHIDVEYSQEFGLDLDNARQLAKEVNLDEE
jgi:CRISPR-associated endonuclease/helicase Cas3